MDAVRRSQQVVAYDPTGNGWAVRASVGADSPPPHAAAGSPRGPRWPARLPSPPRSVSPSFSPRSDRLLRRSPSVPVLPLTPVLPPVPPPVRTSSTAPGGPAPRRAPLRDVTNTNEKTLCKEIATLESKLNRVTEAFLAQNAVMQGLCKAMALE